MWDWILRPILKNSTQRMGFYLWLQDMHDELWPALGKSSDIRMGTMYFIFIIKISIKWNIVRFTHICVRRTLACMQAKIVGEKNYR